MIRTLLLITLLLVPGVTAAATVPKIFFEYSTVFDTACSNLSKKTIKPEWVKELKARQKRLLAPWRRDGRRLLRATVALAGHRFRRSEISATLSLCGLPTTSQPLLLKMHPYLRSFTKGKGESPRAPDLLVGTVHHELLHTYQQRRQASVEHRQEGGARAVREGASQVGSVSSTPWCTHSQLL